MAQKSRLRTAALAVAAAWAASLLPALAPASSAAKITSRFLSADTAKHTAQLTLLAGHTRANSGYNFDGYAKGRMTVKIPDGYTVKVLFTNKAAFNHSALITPYADRTGSRHPLAFPHAGTANPTAGIGPSKSVTFTFRASKAGTYAIVCGVPGHADTGMWDVLQVTRGGSPGTSFKK